MEDDFSQALFRLFGLGARQGFHGAAQRGQRVLELMADIGGEAFDGVDTVVKRRRHFTQCNRKIADLILTRREIRYFLAGSRPAAYADCGGGQPPQWRRDGRGKEQRQDNVDQRGDAEDAHDGEALGMHDLVDIARLRRKQQNAEHRPEALHRHGN